MRSVWPRRLLAGLTLVLSGLPGLPTAIAQTNPVEQENAKPGDPSWAITNVATDREIEGYGSAPSIDRGESIIFYVNTSSPTYTLEIFRMGWYGGAGARRMLPTATLAGVQQPFPSPDPTTGLIECQWSPSFVLQVPDDPSDPTNWMSGIYLVKLTALNTQLQSYILFVVRDDSRSSDFLFQNSVTTYQAYNSWGGMSLYTTPRAYKVSFNRPFNNRPFKRGAGAGDFIGWGWEYCMLRFLEREGYDVTYTTDLDTHARGNLLLNHKGFLVVGHDEYWSWQMRDNVEQARDHGVSLGFFGANIGYWQVRFEPSPATGAPDRTMVCYKSAGLDPIANTGNPSDQRLATTLFRSPPVNRPEDALIGVMYDGGAHNFILADFVISDSSAWVFEGTGLNNGDHLPGLLGYEVDRIFGHDPAWTTRLTHSPYQDACPPGSLGCVTRYSDMTVYDVESGATVAATGSMHWNWGLDSVPPNPLSQASPVVQQATRNILNRFLHPLPYYLEPRTLTFSNQLVGSKSPVQEIVIVNHEDSPLMINQVNTGDNFIYDSGCPSVLLARQRCVVGVSFAPPAIGIFTGNEILTLNIDPANPIQVQLTGTGVDYTLSASPESSTTVFVDAAGEVAEFDLNLISLGFSGTVALSCRAPAIIKCSTDSSGILLSGSTSARITVAAQTSSGCAGAAHTTLVASHLEISKWAEKVSFVCLLAFVSVVGTLVLRRRFSWAFTSALFFALLCTACAGGETRPMVPCQTMPQAISYRFWVDAVANGVTHSVSLELKVRPHDEFPSN